MATTPAWFRIVKVLIYSAVLVNVGAFMWAADDLLAPKAIDQIGWVIILGVFEWETGRLPAGGALTSIALPALAFELTGYACALFALDHYIAIRDPVEILNAVAWLAISALIWIDLFFPEGARGLGRSALRAGLYAVTMAAALWWGFTGAWLDFFDAAIWIVCFFVIELNIFGIPAAGLRR
ncbi:MAG: hypothetical protein WCO11_13475 [Sphingomonadales bacterium]